MKKLQPLIQEFGQEKFSTVELVEVDLNQENTLIDACQGVDIVVHTASPFPAKAPKNEDELIKPAVNGATAAMRGA